MTLEIQKKLQDRFFTACEDYNVNAVKYLLQTPSLAKHIDVGAYDFIVLHRPIRRCDEVMIDCILDKSQEKDLINISKIMNQEFTDACRHGDLNKLNFYYGKEKYKKHLELQLDKVNCFKMAYYGGHIDVLNFLILQVEVTRDDYGIAETMRNNSLGPDASKLFRQTIEIFNKQKLHKALDEKLPVKEDVPIKPKLKI